MNENFRLCSWGNADCKYQKVVYFLNIFYLQQCRPMTSLQQCDLDLGRPVSISLNGCHWLSKIRQQKRLLETITERWSLCGLKINTIGARSLTSLIFAVTCAVCGRPRHGWVNDATAVILRCIVNQLQLQPLSLSGSFLSVLLQTFYSLASILIFFKLDIYHQRQIAVL